MIDIINQGLTPDQILKWDTSFLKDTIKIEKQSGSQGGRTTWTTIDAAAPAKVEEGNGITREINGQEQLFDAEIHVRGETRLQSSKRRYKVTAYIRDSKNKDINGDPVILEEKEFEVVNIESPRTLNGNVLTQILLCVNSDGS